MSDHDQLSIGEIAAIRATVLELSAVIVDNAQRLDPDATFSVYSAAPDATHINMGEVFDREALLQMYRGLYGEARTQVIEFGEPVVSVLSRSVAVVASSGGFEVTTRDGRRIRSAAAWTWVWVCREDGWQLLHSHQSFPRQPSPE